MPPDAGTVLWKHPRATCTRVIHLTKPAYEIRVYDNTGSTSVSFFDDADSAARYVEEQRLRFASFA